MTHAILNEADQAYLRNLHQTAMAYNTEAQILDGLPATYAEFGKAAPSFLLLPRSLELAQQTFRIIDSTMRTYLGELTPAPYETRWLPNDEALRQTNNGIGLYDLTEEKRRTYLINKAMGFTRFNIAYKLRQSGVLAETDVSAEGMFNIDMNNPAHMGMAHAFNRLLTVAAIAHGTINKKNSLEILDAIEQATRPPDKRTLPTAYGLQ